MTSVGGPSAVPGAGPEPPGAEGPYPAGEPYPAAVTAYPVDGPYPVDGSYPVGGAYPVGGPYPPAAGAPPYPVGEPDRFTRLVNRLYARAPRWTAPVAALGCMAAAVGYTLLTNPTTSAPDAEPTCLLKLTTGLDCPGCGGTRAMWYLLHGDLPAAARHHLVFVFVLPFLLYLYVAWAVQQAFGRRLPQLRVTPVTLGVVLAAWAVFSVLRNLPWAPFTALYV